MSETKTGDLTRGAQKITQKKASKARNTERKKPEKDGQRIMTQGRKKKKNGLKTDNNMKTKILNSALPP